MQTTAFVGDVPTHYDRCLGPLLFEDHARDLAGRVDLPEGGSLLEIAAGTGISTEALCQTLSGPASIVATDLNQAMLDLARHRVRDPRVRFEVADVMELAFADASFDAVVHQFGMMFFPDPVAASREIRRVLKPGGQLAFNMWGSLARNPVADVAQSTLEQLFPEDPPRFLHVPFQVEDPAPVEAQLEAAGFDEIQVHRIDSVVERPSAREVAEGFVLGTPTAGSLAERERPLEEVVDAVARELRNTLGDAPLRTALEAFVFIARNP